MSSCSSRDRSIPKPSQSDNVEQGETRSKSSQTCWRTGGRPAGLSMSWTCEGLCPAASPTLQKVTPSYQHSRWISVTGPKYSRVSDNAHTLGLEALPQQCAGCGAFSQTVNKDGPGHYTLTRNSIRKYIDRTSGKDGKAIVEEDAIISAALANAGLEDSDLHFGAPISQDDTLESPLCDRCHQLKHHEVGVSIQHPSARSLQNTVFESPYKYNHVYHVIDAADFPMSFIPGLHKLLHLTPQRAKNRRSRTGKFYGGRKTDISFVITRSDLLAPTKAQVDSLMPYLRDTLRDVLGRSSKNVRLGNIRCVSAKKAWWTKELKEEIWQRGGGGWMVGKVNVGKSQLLHNIFPKGRRANDKVQINTPASLAGSALDLGKTASSKDKLALSKDLSLENLEGVTEADPKSEETVALEKEIDQEDEDLETALDMLDSTLYLPPVQPEVDYPAMPLVSSLPGTTASPIRLSFGNGKGELIDLPGLSRGDLEQHVMPEHRPSLVMRSRISPEQQVIKPGQSLLLGGFIRITPTTPDLIVLSYAFTPIESHLTSTEKAIGTQNKTRESSLWNISMPGTEAKTRSAGIFQLKWDVTRQRTGPITRRDAVNFKPEKLPYCVFATDLLIEGCGWVEIVAQVSKSKLKLPELKPPFGQGDEDLELTEKHVNAEVNPGWPEVEVFSPEGKFIAARRPMNAWLNVANKPENNKRQGRPRKSMKGAKKQEKMRKRMLL